MRSFLFGCFVFLFTGSLTAQSDSVFIRKIANEIFRNGTAYSNLYTLTKSIGQRLSGSPSTYTSEKWAQEAVKKAGADQVFLQKAMIPHWVRGGKDQAALITDLANASKRMARLNKSLILLTKIGNDQFIEKESITPTCTRNTIPLRIKYPL